VFPREILGCIISNTSLSRDDIGAIRIFDNYSFVQVRTAAADEIIEALNGQSFRGRSLVVNYARTRKDEAKPLTEEGTDVPGFSAEPDNGGEAEFFPEDGEGGHTETEDADYREGEETGDGPSVQEDDDHPDKKNI
jgi:hypothetical protein